MIQREKLDQIEQEFIKLYGENNIVLDGITDIDEYIKSEDKILWILKEPWSEKDRTWDLRKFNKNLTEYPNWRRTYKLIIKISYAIHNKIFEYAKIPNESDIKDIMSKIAFINIKKDVGKSRSSYKVINNRFKRDEDLLLEQIKCLEPTIILNCSRVYGLYEKLRIEGIEKPEIIEKTKIVFNAASFNNGIIINAYHPNFRGDPNLYFNKVIDYIQKFKSKGNSA